MLHADVKIIIRCSRCLIQLLSSKVKTQLASRIKVNKHWYCRYIMNQNRSRRFSYGSSLPKPHPLRTPSHIPQSQSLSKSQSPFDVTDELRKSYQQVQILKAEVEVQRQGRQLEEEQNKYLSRKIEGMMDTIDQLQSEVQKLREKYRRLKAKKKHNAEVEPFQQTKSKASRKDLLQKQQQHLKDKLRALQSRINTPTYSSSQKTNPQKLVEQNNSLRKINADTQRKLDMICQKLTERQLLLSQLTKQIDIYQQSNLNTQKGVDLLEREISMLSRENRHLKDMISGSEEMHRREVSELKEALVETQMRSTSMASIPKRRLGAQLPSQVSDFHVERSYGSGSRSRYNSTKKIRY